MPKAKHGRVVRRWGFYLNGRLAYAGVALQSAPPEILVYFTETEHHAHTTPLPQRIRLEKLIRDQASQDIERELGGERIPVIRFDSFSRSESVVASETFGSCNILPLIEQ